MPTNYRDQSAVKHIYNYCLQIENTLAEISSDREKYDKSRTYQNALALCI